MLMHGFANKHSGAIIKTDVIITVAMPLVFALEATFSNVQR